MPRTFPTQPNLEHFRKQAKQLLRDVRDGDDDATQRRRESAGPSRHVVITGGAGFIGSHLAERLLAQGHRVTAFDDLSGCHRLSPT
jgi:phosphoglycerate dehydrogenase-like enzyme